MAETPSPRCILVVDDDGPILGLLRVLLESEGYPVVTATSVREARTSLAERRPDLVLCDVRLPDAPPFALLDRLLSDPATAQLPVVVCSGAIREIEQATERLAHPHVAVLLKPFDIDELLATVARLLSAAAERD